MRYRRVLPFLILLVLLAGCATRPGATSLGDQLMEQGHWDEAVTMYQTALKDDPFNASLQVKLADARRRAAAAHMTRGRAALKERQLAPALEAFKRAMALDPGNADIQSGLADVLRFKEAQDRVVAGEKLLKAGRLDEAAEAFERALELDPTSVAAQDALVQIAEKQRPAPLATIGGRQPVTLKFQNARTKEVFEVLARTAGINFLFDKDMKDEPVTLFVKDATFDEALALLLTTQNLFIRRLSTDTILVIPKTKQKLDQYQDLLIRTFYLSTAKAKEIVNLLRTMLESKRLYVNEDLNAIVIRDSPDKVRLAERIILANDRKPGEVMFEIEVLEVDKTKTEKLGVNIAKQAGAAFGPPGTTVFPAAGTTTTFTYQQLTSIGTGSFLFTLPASILLDFLKSESNAKTLANPKLRVVNNKVAKINIGDKVPILLSNTNTIPGVVPGTVPTSSTITSIEFKDTGVKLSVEPNIHLNNDVSIKLQIEVTRLGDQITLQNNPLIQQFKFGTRTAETTLTLKDGESVVLGGLIQDEDRTTVEKVPGLGDIPVLGEIFKHTTHDVVTTDVILTITPRVIRSLDPPSVDDQVFWSGTEEAYALKPLFTEAFGPVRNVSMVPSRPGGTGTAQRPTATLSFRPADGAVDVGQELKLDLLVADVESFGEATLTVAYDSKILEFRQAMEGEFLRRDGAGTVTAEPNPAMGTVVITLKRPSGGKLLSGGGVLATLTFVGKLPGASMVSLQNPQLLTDGKASVVLTSGQGLVRVR